MYVLPSDSVDRAFDKNGALVKTVSAWQNWFYTQTPGSKLRVDTYNGVLDITFHHLLRTNSQMAACAARGGSAQAFLRDCVEYELIAAGFNRSNKAYLVYYDGSNNYACGGAPIPPKIMGSYVVLYLKGTVPGFTPCSANNFSSDGKAVGYWEMAGLHDTVHQLGFVPSCAPHYTSAFPDHVGDSPADLMYAGTQPWDIAHMKLDVNRDDYYKHVQSGCLDLSRNAFLTPLPTGAVLPPRWPYGNLANQGCTKTVPSGLNSTLTNIEFINARSGSVNVYWLDYSGQPHFYRTIKPLDGYIFQTNVAASWRIRTTAGQCVASYIATTRQSRAVIR